MTDPAGRPRGAHGIADALLDDAAVFPPGLAPLADALAAHRRYRGSALARYVGPFLLPAARHAEFAALLTGDPRIAGQAADVDGPGGGIEVVLIGSPVDRVGALTAAIDGLGGIPGMVLRGVEIPLPPGEDDPLPLLTALGLVLEPQMGIAVELTGADPLVVFGALARGWAGSARTPRGKFRTGGTTPDASPAAATVAAVIRAAVATALPVKFTAGLHHAVTGPHGAGGSTQYGVLNVLTAVRSALVGAPASGVEAALREPDGEALADAVSGFGAGEIAAVRGIFTSFGCCGVTEPLRELAALGVIDPVADTAAGAVTEPPEEP